MRYADDHADRTRANVLEIAAAQVRAHGPHGVSVAGIMKTAGLTHGGFYAHFQSKDDLLAHAVRHMFSRSIAVQKALDVNDTGFDRLRVFVRAYVSRAHRDRPEDGCALTTLANDVARLPAPVRAAFDEGAAQLSERLVSMIPPHVPDRRNLGLSILCQMVGAVALSRAISDPDVSDRVLKQTRRDVFARIDALEEQAK